jgi:predicted Zn-dependent protease
LTKAKHLAYPLKRPIYKVASYDSILLIIHPEDGQETGGETFPFDASITRNYMEEISVIRINARVLKYGAADPNPSFTKGFVIVHEVGHYFGLLHPYSDSCAVTVTESMIRRHMLLLMMY